MKIADIPNGFTIGNSASVTNRKPWIKGHAATLLSESTIGRFDAKQVRTLHAKGVGDRTSASRVRAPLRQCWDDRLPARFVSYFRAIQGPHPQQFARLGDFCRCLSTR